ncbi:MAG TPA: TolC family protein [Hanamia sp.]|nr:TolC family protein [Hanamia sp.]
MKRYCRISVLIILTFFFFKLPARSQDSLMTAQEAIQTAIENNYGVLISKNEIEIGSINNSWANTGVIPIVSATATKQVGVNNLQQKLNNGTVITKNGNSSQNLNAGIAVNWKIFDGLKMFATKKRLEELERIGEYAFRKNLNETVYNVISSYYNIVTLNEQRKATLEQISLYNDRYALAERRFEIGTGAKYEVLQAQVDLNEQRSNLLALDNSIATAKASLLNLLGKQPDTSFNVIDTILIADLPPYADVQNKIAKQNPDLLLANSQLYILKQQKKEINADRLPSVNLNGYYNFSRNSSSAGFNLFNQTYGPSGSIGISVPLFAGIVVKKQLQISDIQLKDQQITIDQTRNNIQTELTNAYLNYNNALKAIELEKNNLVLAKENIIIATERYKRLNITSVELRQIQISYNDARNRLYNALYQAKIAEATVALLSGDIANL